MIINASQIRFNKDGKSAQVVVLVGDGANRKSKTIYVDVVAGGILRAPNPYHTWSALEKMRAEVRKKIEVARKMLVFAQKRETNMVALACEKHRWLRLTKEELVLAGTTWHNHAIAETKEASANLDTLINELKLVEEMFPFTVTFESAVKIPAGKKPAADKKRAA